MLVPNAAQAPGATAKPPLPRPRTAVPASSFKRHVSLSNTLAGLPRPVRRPIKADFSILQMNDSDDDEDDEDSPSESPQEKRPAPQATRSPNPWKRTGSPVPRMPRPRPTITQDEYHHFCDTALESYDLATQCPSRRASMRRHTIVACGGVVSGGAGWLRDPDASASVPPSRPDSRQSDVDSQRNQELTWSRTSLQDELLQSKQWQDALSLDERLSLTLEEIVHIRSVLTKAELEGLPVECRVKSDAEKRKVCFLCLKTRFGIFGPWGQRCKLCKRTVCTKCYSKMRIPTEHFSNVPVVLLSPSMGTPRTTPPPSAPCSPGGGPHHQPLDESFPRSLMARLMLPDYEKKTHNSIGSAPNSPNKGRCSAPDSMTCSMEEGPKSLPPSSPRHQTMDRRSRFGRTITSAGGAAGASERLRGELMNVCHDCRSLVIQIIRASRPTRSALRNHALRNLTLDLSPVYTNAGNT